MPEVQALESADIVNAITHLSERMDEFEVKQRKSTEGIEKVLGEWSQVNLALMECLKEQTTDTRTHLEQQNQLALHLLTLGTSAKIVEVSSIKLGGSLSNLTRHLEEKQAVQLNDLSQHNQKLQTSTEGLMSYLKGEQSKRLKILESGLGSLINLMEQIPGIEKLRTKEKGWNFDFVQSLSSISLCSLFTAALVLGVLQASAGEKLVRVDERATWTILKLEEIEDILEIRNGSQ